MLRLGLKLTHDGGFALLDGTTLVCSHETEKSGNQPRHAPLRLSDVEPALELYGASPDDVDRVLVDGWIDSCATIGEDGREATLPVAPYHETQGHRDVLMPLELTGLGLGKRSMPYLSYTHAAGHAAGTYAVSPWARDGLSALVLVWDGAMLPRLYRIDPNAPAIEPLRPLLACSGHVYPVFGSHFGPFIPGDDAPTHDELPKEALLDLSGKVMAWVGLGEVRDDLVSWLERVYSETASTRWEFVFDFARAARRHADAEGLRDEDVVASFQAFLGGKLVAALARMLEHDPELPRRLCFTGGCALNIAWNAQLRACGLFEDVWVPPFPNDAGSGLGVAAADLLRSGEGPAIDWDVYRGQPLIPSSPADGWSAAPCDIPALAGFLHDTERPVVFLNGRAELGPRALGNRSILCSARSAHTKELLNDMKAREWYRPVAPICLEDDAPAVFDPGSPDPYMLFTHRVRSSWRDRVPAIVHVDGTARLQTIRREQNPTVAALLAEYRRLSGIPLLCNTSANLKGSGFFPDLRSATEWPPARHVWCDQMLFTRDGAGAQAEPGGAE